MARCPRCRGEIEERFRFCPWCASPQRTKIVEFFAPHPRDAGKALRVSRYLTKDPHVRFSVWSDTGVAEAAVSLREAEAARLARFLEPIRRPKSLLDAARRVAGRPRPRKPTRTS
ncbi:MAG TPA: zinc ribbon domain-containing protein [Gaiellaceae bacterium]